MEAEPSLACAFNICAPANTAALMFVAERRESNTFTGHPATRCLNSDFLINLTSSFHYFLCKYFGSLQICTCGLNELSFPVKYFTIKSDETKEVLFCQVIQNMD